MSRGLGQYTPVAASRPRRQILAVCWYGGGGYSACMWVHCACMCEA
jgi:hypothetical protein